MVAVQAPLIGLYRPPELKRATMGLGCGPDAPPQIIKSVSVQRAVKPLRDAGALLVLIGDQALATGLKRPPVADNPFQTIRSMPDQIPAVVEVDLGEFAVAVRVQELVAGL